MIQIDVVGVLQGATHTDIYLVVLHVKKNMYIYFILLDYTYIRKQYIAVIK